MKLYLLRHGIAEESCPGGSDAERALTKEGRRKTRKALQGLRALGVSNLPVFSSPFRRARQTAEIAARILNGSAAVILCNELQPGTPVESILGWLRSRKEEAVMLVGHEPDLSQLAAALLTPDGSLDLALKRAGVCVIEIDRSLRGGRGRLLALFTPRSLRLIRAPRTSKDEEE